MTHRLLVFAILSSCSVFSLSTFAVTSYEGDANSGSESSHGMHQKAEQDAMDHSAHSEMLHSDMAADVDMGIESSGSKQGLGFGDSAVTVRGLRIIAPIPGQSVSAGYMQVTNIGSIRQSIVAVSSESASRVEMHTHTMANGMMSMQRVDQVEIGVGDKVVFEPGGYHLMVFDPSPEAIEAGQLSLVFELSSGNRITVNGAVEHLRPKAAPSAHQGH